MRYAFVKLRRIWCAQQSRTPRELADAVLEELALGVGGGELEGTGMVRESIRRPP